MKLFSCRNKNIKLLVFIHVIRGSRDFNVLKTVNQISEFSLIERLRIREPGAHAPICIMGKLAVLVIPNDLSETFGD